MLIERITVSLKKSVIFSQTKEHDLSLNMIKHSLVLVVPRRDSEL